MVSHSLSILSPMTSRCHQNQHVMTALLVGHPLSMLKQKSA